MIEDVKGPSEVYTSVRSFCGRNVKKYLKPSNNTL